MTPQHIWSISIGTRTSLSQCFQSYEDFIGRSALQRNGNIALPQQCRESCILIYQRSQGARRIQSQKDKLS